MGVKPTSYSLPEQTPEQLKFIKETAGLSMAYVIAQLVENYATTGKAPCGTSLPNLSATFGA